MVAGFLSLRHFLAALICGLAIVLAGCEQKDNSHAEAKPMEMDSIPVVDSTPTTIFSEKKDFDEIEEKVATVMNYWERWKADSVKAEVMLLKAIGLAEEKREAGDFEILADSLSIEYGNHFSSSRKHLIVRIHFPVIHQNHIFLFKGNAFQEVMVAEIDPMVLIGDTIRDVNGDGRLDFLMHWYPASGCCLRDIYDVYLQRANGGFAEKREFINPVFSPKEKVIRGMMYGYSAPLYKYKWNGYTVDTIEFITGPDSSGEYFRKKRLRGTSKGIPLKDLPQEYKNIGYGGY